MRITRVLNRWVVTTNTRRSKWKRTFLYTASKKTELNHEQIEALILWVTGGRTRRIERVRRSEQDRCNDSLQLIADGKITMATFYEGGPWVVDDTELLSTTKEV